MVSSLIQLVVCAVMVVVGRMRLGARFKWWLLIDVHNPITEPLTPCTGYYYQNNR
jgi:hypothetical protein